MTRQTRDDPPVRMVQGLKRQGEGMPMHAHDESQLTFAASGMMQVRTDAGRWLVPSQLAVWVPAGMLHQIDVLSDAELWMIYWRPHAMRRWAPGALDRAFALRVTPLLEALIAAAFATAAPEKTDLVVRLILRELIELPDAPTFLPMPTSPVGRRAADIALADPRNGLDIAAIASRAATSVRSLSRLFPIETGMTFKAWRQRARIVRAIDQLAAGDAIAQVAANAGFASTAAFSYAFRQVTLTTPTAFLDQPLEAGAMHRMPRSRLPAVSTARGA